MRGHLIGAIVALALALAAGPAATSASAEVLVNQQPGPSGVAVHSDETSGEWSEALDDFYVPAGTHWQLEGIRVFGASAVQRPRTFMVKIYWGNGGSFPLFLEPEFQVFGETVTPSGEGPDYLIPIDGASLLPERSGDDSPQYWITVQALSTGGEDEWTWLTGPDTPGTAPADPREVQGAAGAEPGLAFELLGTAEQILRVQVANSFANTGAVVSDPPGISCLLICEVALPRGATVTLSASPLLPSVKFTQWGFVNPAYAAPSRSLVPTESPRPCAGTSASCTFTLGSDEQVEANFEPIDEVDVLHVILDRRHGRGELVVWVPGEGVLSTFSYGVKKLSTETVPAGVARIPLVPVSAVAKRLHRKGSAKVGIAVNFRPIKGVHTGTVQLHPTLVRKAAKKPARGDH
jgi:hypothetical protein